MLELPWPLRGWGSYFRSRAPREKQLDQSPLTQYVLQPPDGEEGNEGQEEDGRLGHVDRGALPCERLECLREECPMEQSLNQPLNDGEDEDEEAEHQRVIHG